MKTVMIMIVFVVMMGCKLQKETTNNTDSITIEEYACEGTCPVYTLTFYSNRLGKYNGKMNVIKVGEHDVEFSKDEIRGLFESVSRINFSELNDIYDSKIMDLPPIVIIYGEKSIRIQDLRLVPEELKELVIQLKALAKSTNYID